MLTRLAAASGLLAPLTYSAALFFGDLAQPGAYSSADDAISDLGAETASSAWIYNQVGVNLTGALVMVVGLGLWRALSPDLLGRLGAVAVALAGLTLFLQGFFRLDCQGIDPGCENTSWHSDAHSLATGVSAAFIFASPIVLAFAFRRIARWRNAWLPTLAVIPASLAASVLFSLAAPGRRIAPGRLRGCSGLPTSGCSCFARATRSWPRPSWTPDAGLRGWTVWSGGVVPYVRAPRSKL